MGSVDRVISRPTDHFEVIIYIITYIVCTRAMSLAISFFVGVVARCTFIVRSTYVKSFFFIDGSRRETVK